MSKVILGTELKLNINIDPIGNYTMADYDFDITLISGTMKKQSKTYSKKGGALDNGLKQVDKNNYIVAFDTRAVGVGKLMVQVVAYIPDTDFVDDQTRTEIVEMETGIQIVNSII